MADTRLPLEVNARPLDTATPIRQANQDQQQNALNHEKLLQEHFNTLDARERSRLQSTVAGAQQLKTFLDANDMQGARRFLLQRRGSLSNEMANGADVDTQETDYALQAIDSGNVESLKNEVNGLLAAGHVYGLIQKTDTPANVQEWQYYNNLSPQDQEKYLTMKRSNSTVNLGGSQIVPSQVNPAGPPQASFNVTPKPEDMPAFREQQAEAAARGTAAGEANANANTTMTKAGGLLAALEDLKVASEAAPSGIISGGIAYAGNKTGLAGSGAIAQGNFSVKRAAAENAIREAFRVAGSGATSDRDAVPFIQMLPEALDSDSVKVAKTDAAMQAVRTRVAALAAQRGIPDPFATPAGAFVQLIDPDTGDVYEFDAQTAAEAEKAGWRRK